MLVSGADDVVKDIKQQSDELGKRYGSIFVEAPRASRRRSFYNFFLRHQDAVDDSLTSPSVHRKTAINTNNTTSTSTSSTSASASASASAGATINVDQQQAAVTPTRKRASSFIRKKPPLERGLSAQSALRVNKNAFVSDGPAPEVIVTKPSPEQQTHPLAHGHSLSLRPDNATLVHVLVHRESEEYKEEDDECSQSSHVSHSTSNSNGNGNGNGNSQEKPKPPQIRITTGSSESAMDTCLMPTVQIMVDSPKEPPRGDFSMESGFTNAPLTPAIDVDAPIDVNVQGDTSQVFYDYNPESNIVHATDMVVAVEEGQQQVHPNAAEASGRIEDQQR
ncbi:hypothetical protein KR093_007198 [Drosophila rubida]|uniref:Uncharacterized protein n=1 Tax=Drosophila rubida TaxID=30044 RepID=A0AAD4PLQ5_9MUSC|nr:hypothetical protein KR093_007198 [Drosophila rubida]